MSERDLADAIKLMDRIAHKCDKFTNAYGYSPQNVNLSVDQFTLLAKYTSIQFESKVSPLACPKFNGLNIVFIPKERESIYPVVTGTKGNHP